MRFIIALIALFLLLGCAGSPPANQTPGPPPQPAPGAPPPLAPPVQPPPATPPAVQPPPEPPPVSGNITDNQTNRPKGLLFGGGKYLLALDDVSIIPNSEEPCGIFSLRNSTDYSTYEKMLICPPDSQEWTSPDGHTYRIKVIKVAAGYSGADNWVDVIIYG